MDTPHSHFEQVEAELDRLACEIAVTGSTRQTLAALRRTFDACARLLEEAGLAGDLAASLRIGAADARAATLDETLAAARQALADATRHAGAVAISAEDASEPHGAGDLREGGAEVDDLSLLQSDPEIAAMFVAEALDHLGSIETIVLQLEAAPDDATLLNDVFRPFHTIKGNAGALGLGSVQRVAHTLENLLDAARAGQHRIGAADIDLILRAVDVLSGIIRGVPERLAGRAVPDREAERLAVVAAVEARMLAAEDSTPAGPAGEPLTGGTAPVSTRVAGPESTVKIDTGKLDNLVDMVGELVIVESIIQEDPALARALDERLGRNLAQLRRITTDLQRTAMSMRMVPIRHTFQKMARLVRDLSRASDKNIELTLSGEDTELDRRVVEDISDPLMHMVRNSVDHGIEPPATRAAAGKPPQGRLALRAFHEGGNVVIEIADDGAGLDTAKILSKAVEGGLVPEGAQLSTAEIHRLIFRPGFSTADRVTEISGRGVGMDVVARNIDALRGRVEIQSTFGVGTTMLLKLPLTLAIIDGLLVSVGRERFVLPTYAIAESLRASAEQLHSIGGEIRMVRVRDTLLPLVRISALFGVSGAEEDPTRATIVVVEDGGRRLAILVDRLIGKQEVVIKSLGTAFRGVRGVAGGAILGDGRVGLILDAGGIFGVLDDGAHGAQAA